jgi:hypothetical protein
MGPTWRRRIEQCHSACLYERGPPGVGTGGPLWICAYAIWQWAPLANQVLLITPLFDVHTTEWTA